jgi:uncharacterized protein (TIGR00297 family)
VAFAAFRFKSLSRSGAWTAFFLGAVVFGLGGIAWTLVLLTFFITSSGLSILFKKRKIIPDEKYAKGSRRDAYQVLANGGLAGISVVAHVFFPASFFPWLAFCAAFAAANADTWATELGILNKVPPRLISTGRVVPAGTSGGVSTAGLLASAAGSFLIAIAAYLTWSYTGLDQSNRLVLSVFVLIAGFAGSVVDSLIGATIQGAYWCPTCAKETEKHPMHGCGSVTQLVRGKGWMTNDVVNLICTASGIFLVGLLFVMLF